MPRSGGADDDPGEGRRALHATPPEGPPGPRIGSLGGEQVVASLVGVQGPGSRVHGEVGGQVGLVRRGCAPGVCPARQR